MSLSLLSSMNRVETPFVIAELGGVSFGIYSTETRNVIQNNSAYRTIVATYPNFINSLTVTKINGTVNTYTLQLIYAITKGDDPNLLEKIFSKAKKDNWRILLSYGDLSLPSFIYKQEQAMITKIKSNISFDSSRISYTLSCTSTALLGNTGTYNFPKLYAKPSDKIKELLYDNRYGLLEIFSGMRDRQKVLSNNLIAGDDNKVTIEAKTNITALDYLQYLVNCMSGSTQASKVVIKPSTYKLVLFDSISDIFDGPYFKVIKLLTDIKQNTLDTYTIDIGYPDNNIVLSFNVDTDETYSRLYDYSLEVDQPKYIKRIDNQGNLLNEYSPAISNTSELMKTTESSKVWWTNMTSFPITATLVIKGLIRPAILMSYVYIDARFFGEKHYSSGYYAITKQVDSITANGYRTTLTLLKIRGDD